MRGICVATALAGMLLADETRADDTRPIIWGEGLKSCGTGVAQRNDPDATVATVRTGYMLMWMEGYISGVNAATYGQVSRTQIERNAIEVWGGTPIARTTRWTPSRRRQFGSTRLCGSRADRAAATPGPG